MFIGEYQHNLDAKGRIIIPSKFRDELHSTFMLAQGFENCLTVYSIEQWNKRFEEISKLPTTKKNARMYIRTLTAKACECTPDNQGRIQIPSTLTKPNNITKECVIIGANDHIEIWDKAAWDSYYAEASNSLEDIAENLNELVDE